MIHYGGVYNLLTALEDVSLSVYYTTDLGCSPKGSSDPNSTCFLWKYALPIVCHHLLSVVVVVIGTVLLATGLIIDTPWHAHDCN